MAQLVYNYEKIQEKYTNTFWFYRMFASPYQEY